LGGGGGGKEKEKRNDFFPPERGGGGGAKTVTLRKRDREERSGPTSRKKKKAIPAHELVGGEGGGYSNDRKKKGGGKPEGKEKKGKELLYPENMEKGERGTLPRAKFARSREKRKGKSSSQVPDRKMATTNKLFFFQSLDRGDSSLLDLKGKKKKSERRRATKQRKKRKNCFSLSTASEGGKRNLTQFKWKREANNISSVSGMNGKGSGEGGGETILFQRGEGGNPFIFEPIRERKEEGGERENQKGKSGETPHLSFRGGGEEKEEGEIPHPH